MSQHIAEDEPPAVRKRIRAEKHLSPGDMYPRMPYFPVCHGYYYFRPYNFRHISKHQQIALRWGNDPRMPYSNRLFDDLYRNLGVAAVEELPEPAAARRPQEPADFFQPLEDY